MPPTGPLGSGPLWGGPFMGGGFRRRRGFNLLPMGGFGWGGMGGFGGMGGMGGGGLMGDLLAGGIGYMMGRRTGQQYQQPQYQQPQYQPPPQQYQAPYYQPPQAPQYQPPPQQYQQPQPQYQQPAAGASNETLAQLRLLGHLRDSGRLTNDEFEAEKQKILHGQ